MPAKPSNGLAPPPPPSGAADPVPAPPVRTASPEAVEEAVAVLRRGGLVALPTETVYGLGADASNPAAVRRVFDAKGRPHDHPLIVHVAGAAAIDRWSADASPLAHRLAEAFWPGPLTLVLPRADGVPDEVTGGRPTVALRVPDQPLTLAVLERFGGGIAAPSANRFGRVSPTRAEHVVADLGDAVDLVLDGGPCRVGVESTIVELVDDRLRVLRLGAVTPADLERVAGRPVDAVPAGPARAPGMLASHYAPRARVVVTDDAVAAAAELLATGQRVAVLAEVLPVDLPEGAVVLEPVGDPDGYARHLYDRLRAADAMDVDVILAVPPAPDGVGLAVRDRLARAAHDPA
jgi:L-threonylcarbamoyladenylate synthase